MIRFKWLQDDDMFRPKQLVYELNEAMEAATGRDEFELKKELSALEGEIEIPWQLRLYDAIFRTDVGETLKGFETYYEERMSRGGEMSDEEIAFREDIAQKITPISYDWSVHDIARKLSDDDRPYSQENFLEKDPVEPQVRADAFRIYLGLEPYGNHFVESPYKPSISEDSDAVYYSFPTENLIISMTVHIKERIYEDGELVDKIPTPETFDELKDFIHRYERLPNNDYTFALGRYTVGIGYDEERQEEYISYYDIWDLDHPRLGRQGIDLDEYNFPFETYGRIYESDFERHKVM